MIEKSNRIRSLMAGLYTGPNWVSVDILSSIQHLTPEQANKRILPQSNTIWEIVRHMTGWRMHIMRRLMGEELPSPAHNYIEEVTDTSAESWETTLRELERSQQEWLTYLSNFSEDKFDNVYAPSETTHYEFVHGIIQHDYYHLGQIKMLVKYV